MITCEDRNVFAYPKFLHSCMKRATALFVFNIAILADMFYIIE